MFQTVFLFVVACVAILIVMIVALGRGHGQTHEINNGDRFVFTATLIALVVFGCLTFYAGPKMLGQGRVSSSVKEYTDRLENGVVYHVAASEHVGTGTPVTALVLLVQKYGTPDYFAIRVKGIPAPPEYFVLIDGKPFGLIQPVAAK